ncbi:hypothetical protein [Streptomyces sp. NPDC006270]|uniref:hypothetical protein n=1 Tax=Streptomyces sp. NPDC006270 TaxID=3364741 RepID=UPI0036873564
MQISSLMPTRNPALVVIVPDDGAAAGASVSAVLRAHRPRCGLGTLMSVATHRAPARHLLEANADTSRPHLVIHARITIAISAACAAAT